MVKAPCLYGGYVEADRLNGRNSDHSSYAADARSSVLSGKRALSSVNFLFSGGWKTLY